MPTITRADVVKGLADYLAACATNITPDYDAAQAVALDGVDGGTEVAWELIDHLHGGVLDDDAVEEEVMALAFKLAPHICRLMTEINKNVQEVGDGRKFL